MAVENRGIQNLARSINDVMYFFFVSAVMNIANCCNHGYLVEVIGTELLHDHCRPMMTSWPITQPLVQILSPSS